MPDTPSGDRAIVRIGIVIEVVVELRPVVVPVEVRHVAVLRNRTAICRLSPNSTKIFSKKEISSEAALSGIVFKWSYHIKIGKECLNFLSLLG